MECNRCCLQPVIHAFTQSNIDNSLGRMKTKEIIAAVNNLKVVFKGMCERCQQLPSETNKLVEDLRQAFNTRMTSVVKSMQSDAEAMGPIIEDLRSAFQTVCLTCAKVSNDDNPSNHGQTFVSLDSGSCQANSGRAKSTHTDDNVVLSRADWIGMHRAADAGSGHTMPTDPGIRMIMDEEKETYSRITDGSSTSLPAEVEDVLRREFSNFVELDIIDKLLLSCIMSGMNIAEFAKMLWLPYSIVDPKTHKVRSITKQAAHARWANICKRFPVFMSVAVSTAKDNERAMEKLRKFLADPNGEEKTNRFQNGKMSAAYAKAAQKAKELAERKKAEEIQRARKMAEAAEKEKKRKAKNSLKNFPDDARDCLPGLF